MSSMRLVPLTLAFMLAMTAASAQTPVLDAVYFGEIGCDHCDVFLYSQRASLEARHGVTLRLVPHDILKPDDYALCVQMLAPFAQEFRTFPVLFMGNNVYQGNDAIDANIDDEIVYYLGHATYRPRVTPHPAMSSAPAGFTARFAPVFLAGLLDGINPCAFSALLFFLSYMTMRRRSRAMALAAGTVFVASVFAVYFMLGLGLLSGLRAIMGFRYAGLISNSIISVLAVIMGLASVRDALRARAGNPGDAVMKMPEVLSRSTRLLIRTTSTWTAALTSSAIAGAGVSLLELACTGQIYLPTLAFINRTNRTGTSILLLLAYNTAFVLPLLLLFAVFFLGTSHERIRSWYRGKIFMVRVLTACFFFAMAALIWLV